MKKTGKILLILLIIIVICLCFVFLFNDKEIKTIKNDKDLMQAYENYNYDEPSVLEKILFLPFRWKRKWLGFRDLKGK